MSNLIQMTYVSTTTNPVKHQSAAVQVDIGRILMQSRKNNARLKIGGVLYFRDNYFFQRLEGDQKDVNELYKKISRDPRHTDLQIISTGHIEDRMFANWSMKYVAKEESINRLLRFHGQHEFNPYLFNQEMIDQMLRLFVASNDPTAKQDKRIYQLPPRQPKQGFLHRLFG